MISALWSWLKSPLATGSEPVACVPTLTLPFHCPFEIFHRSTLPLVGLYQSASLVPSVSLAGLMAAGLIVVYLTVNPNSFKPRIASAVKERGDQRSKNIGSIGYSVLRPFSAVISAPNSSC